MLLPKHGAVTTDSSFASAAVIVERRVVKIAKFLLLADGLAVFGLESVNRCGDLFDEAAINELVYSQIGPAVRARLPLLHQPFL